jgi:hypothetical protein
MRKYVYLVVVYLKDNWVKLLFIIWMITKDINENESKIIFKQILINIQKTY